MQPQSPQQSDELVEPDAVPAVLDLMHQAHADSSQLCKLFLGESKLAATCANC